MCGEQCVCMAACSLTMHELKKFVDDSFEELPVSSTRRYTNKEGHEPDSARKQTSGGAHY